LKNAAIAAEIDKLCKEYNVLFVVTTGNYPISSAVPNPASSYPDYFNNDDTRLCEPGEAMLALTVGSIVSAKQTTPYPPFNYQASVRLFYQEKGDDGSYPRTMEQAIQRAHPKWPKRSGVLS